MNPDYWTCPTCDRKFSELQVEEYLNHKCNEVEEEEEYEFCTDETCEYAAVNHIHPDLEV